VKKACECSSLLSHQFTGTKHLLFVAVALLDQSAELTSLLTVLSGIGCNVDSLKEEMRIKLGYAHAGGPEFLSPRPSPMFVEAAPEPESEDDDARALSPASSSEISDVFSHTMKLIFRVASNCVGTGGVTGSSKKIELGHLLQAFRDLKDPKLQFAIEAMLPYEADKISQLDEVFNLRKPSARRCMYQGLEMSDGVCELYYRTLKTVDADIGPHHILTAMLTFLDADNELIVTSLRLLRPGGLSKGQGKKLLKNYQTVGSSMPVAAGVDRVLRRAKVNAASNGEKEITVSHLVPAWVAECRYSENDFAAKHAAALEALLEYVRTTETVQKFHGRRKSAPLFGDDVYRVFDEGRPTAVAAKMDRLEVNHVGIGLLRLLASNSDFESKTKINTDAFAKALQSMVFAQFDPWYTLHNAVIFTMGRIDEHISDLFWAGPASFDRQRMSKFELFQVLSFRSELVIKFALREARVLAGSKVTIDDVLVGLACETLGSTFPLFCSFGIDTSTVRGVIADLRAELSRQHVADPVLDQKLVELLEMAWRRARRFRDVLIEPEHILFALVDHSRGMRLLEVLDLNSSELTGALLHLMLEERQRYLAAYY
jgi:hypothetical protein